MFEQAVLAIQDEATFGRVLASLERVFADAQVAGFLQGLEKRKLRARQFEEILSSGVLGASAASDYAALGDSDRGHVREQYLSMVEEVAPELRAKYLKVYAYY